MDFSRIEEPQPDWTTFVYYIIAVLGLMVMGIGDWIFSMEHTNDQVVNQLIGVLVVSMGVALLTISFIALMDSHNKTEEAIKEWEENKKFHDALDEANTQPIINGLTPNYNLQGETNE